MIDAFFIKDSLHCLSLCNVKNPWRLVLFFAIFKGFVLPQEPFLVLEAQNSDKVFIRF
jgi:hypothetical protein